MNLRDILAMGLKSLKERPLESGLIILGIAIASCVSTAALLLQGSQRQQTELLLQGPAYRELIVRSISPSDQGNQDQAFREIVQSTGQRTNLGDEDIAAAAAQIPEIAAAYRYRSTTMRSTGSFGGFGGQGNPPPEAAADSPSAGETPQASTSTESLLETRVSSFRSLEASAGFFAAYGLNTSSGSFFTDADSNERRSVIVLGADLARRLFPDLDPAGLAGRSVRLGNRIHTILGVLDEPSGNVTLANGARMGDLAFTPSFTVVIQNGGQTIRFNRGNSTLRFTVGDSRDLDKAASALESFFNARYGTEKVSITVPRDQARLNQAGFDRLLTLIVAFGTGAFLMAMINLMNMMLTRTLRRQSALGILSAMGASRRILLSLQAVEGMTMALIGTALGLALAVPLYGVLHDTGRSLFGMAQGSAPLDPGTFLLAAPAMVIAALAMALIPAAMGSRLNIALALKAE